MFPHRAPRLRSLVIAVPTLMLAVAFAGCAHNYHVKVDALCNPEVAAGSSYRIVPHDEVAADFNPNFDEAVRLIETALATRGFHPAAAPNEAELVIEVDFGLGSRRRRVIDNVELLGAPVVPAAPSTTPAGAPVETAAYMQGGKVLDAPPPTRTTVITFHEKFLTLFARETERATRGLRKPAELWRVKVVVEEPDETIDACLPVLVLAAANTIGVSTETRTRVRVAERAPEILLANSGL